ncbi:hypothetical protein CR513_45966, partial [Mucuna pruriens]
MIPLKFRKIRSVQELDCQLRVQPHDLLPCPNPPSPPRLALSATGRSAVRKGSHSEHIQQTTTTPLPSVTWSGRYRLSRISAFASSHHHDSTADSHCDRRLTF